MGLPETFGSRCTSPLVPFTFRKLDKTQVFRWKIHQDYHKTTISSKIAPRSAPIIFTARGSTQSFPRTSLFLLSSCSNSILSV